MERCERLGKLIGMSAEDVQNNIDEGMIEILIELNSKGYRTNGCCEGHLKDNYWHGYISFTHSYKFPIYPKDFSAMRKRESYEWNGKDEESRQNFLNGLKEWAKMLPYKPLIEKKNYTLMGKSKNRLNAREKVLINTTNFEDIKAILNRRDMDKYDLRIFETVIERY